MNNPKGDFKVTLDVQTSTRRSGPAELLKVYDPDGRPVGARVIPDDGVAQQSPPLPWDHEAWYYAAVNMQGDHPMLRWMRFSVPDRLGTIPKADVHCGRSRPASRASIRSC